MTIRTKRGAIRRYNALLRKCWKQFSGDPFGIDWVTLKIIAPEMHKELDDLKRLYQTLPD